MKVKIRHFEEAKGTDFTEIHFSEAEALIAWIKSSGGFEQPGERRHPFHSYDLVYEAENDGAAAFMEIIIGKEDSQ